jgi:hypothetical protein
MEKWNIGGMEKNSYKLRVRGKDVLQLKNEGAKGE